MSPDTGGLLVGVDVGTTRVKALALTPDGVELGSAERVTPWRHTGPHTDVDPVLLADTVTQTCVDVARIARTRADRPVTVLAVGFTGMSETGVLIDASGQPCAPALAWYDTRADVATVEAAYGGNSGNVELWPRTIKQRGCA